MREISEIEFKTQLDKTEFGKQYLDIVEKVLKENRGIQKQRGYERHHIHPKALGGKDSDENLIKLTIIEHCQVHALLAQALPCYETLLPITKMTFGQCKKVSDMDNEFLENMYNWSTLREEAQKVRQGRKLSPEHCKKIGDAHRGKIISEEQRKHHSEVMRGRKHTEEYKRKVSEALKGGNSTSWKKGNIPWNKGKKMSFEEIEKRKSLLSPKKICYCEKTDCQRSIDLDKLTKFLEDNPDFKVGRRPYSEETRKKMSEAKKGSVLSKDTRRKMSKSHTQSGKYVNIEYT